MRDDIKYWVAFHRIPGVGRVRIGLLEKHFPAMESAWGASAAQLAAAGLDARSVSAVVSARPSISPDAEMQRLERLEVRALLHTDPAYPARLREIYDPPPVLYVKGTLAPEDEWSVTIVGTRRVTAYGREAAWRLATELSRNHVTVVSGLAMGVDAAAHQAALEAGGRTLAVLACGLDMVYPSSNTALAQRIIHQGALLSDYPLGTRPKPEFFPRRNRILAGITMGTLVVEAPERSGALITARLANEEGREVFAVPGSILSPASQGTNRLIQDGAKLVMGVGDILEELNVRPAPQQMPLPGITAVGEVDDKEALLLGLLSHGPVHVDELRRSARLPVSEVSSALVLMELRGLVRQMGPMNYVRVPAA